MTIHVMIYVRCSIVDSEVKLLIRVCDLHLVSTMFVVSWEFNIRVAFASNNPDHP